MDPHNNSKFPNLESPRCGFATGPDINTLSKEFIFKLHLRQIKKLRN